MNYLIGWVCVASIIPITSLVRLKARKILDFLLLETVALMTLIMMILLLFLFEFQVMFALANLNTLFFSSKFILDIGIWHSTLVLPANLLNNIECVQVNILHLDVISLFSRSLVLFQLVKFLFNVRGCLCYFFFCYA